MGRLNFAASAEMFSQVPSKDWARMSRTPQKFRRFESLALAVQFAVESDSGNLTGILIRSGTSEFGGAAIRALYDSPAYPLAKK